MAMRLEKENVRIIVMDYFKDYLKHQNLLEVSDESEVIGNIHDNPELIGGKGNA